MMDTAEASFSWVKCDAATPYSSILPVDSGVFSARKRAFSTPSAQTLSGTSKCTVSPSTCVLTVALVLAVAEDMFSFSCAT